MPRMHTDQIDVDEALLHELLRAQFPQWADLPVAAVAEHGTDHALYRLGDELVARLPVIGWADGQAAFEAEWLPRLAPGLPVELSVPVAVGTPSERYPFAWSVNPWLPGQPLDLDRVATGVLAEDLGRFVRALQACDATGAGLFGSRGQPLDEPGRDRATRESLAAADDLVDAAAALAVWEAGQAAPAWDRPPAWFHGDLLPGNLLVRDGRLSAVLDWGPSGAGDPAVELAAAYTLFDDPADRARFVAEVAPDEATWLRARAWKVSLSAMGIPYYRDTVPAFAESGIRAIEAVLAEEP